VNQLYAKGLGHLEDALVAVKLAIDDAAQAGIRDLFEAVPARAGGHIEGPAVDHHAVLRGLENRIALCVDGGHAMVVLHHMPDLGTMGHAPDGTVVAGGQDGLLAHDDRTDEFARAGRPRRHHARDVHEVLVPGSSLSHGDF